jgi:outer membrane protein assembly factor BamB
MSPPTATGGTIYVNGYSTFYAVSSQDGTVKWSAPNRGSVNSSPAVTPTAVYVTDACQAFALSPLNGSVIWNTTSSCGGIGGRTPVFYNSRVYIRDNDIGNVALDAGTGIPVAEIPPGPAPAFHGSTGFFLNVITSTLEARDISSGTMKWSFTGDGSLVSPPLVVNGFVYIASSSGKLFAVDENTGANVWTGTVGAPVIRPNEISGPLTGLGAGEGLIVVPATNLVVAYEAAPVPPPVIYAEEGTNNAAALDSVTFVRGPFRLSNPNNFSVDQRTRIIFFTSNLGLTQADLSDPTALVVELAGVNLPVENVGTISIPGLSTSYIIVRLPDNVPTGLKELKVKLRGVSSDARMLNITP